MKFSEEGRKDWTKWIIGVVAACILIYLGIKNIPAIADTVSWVLSLMMPLILGLAFALIFNVPMRFLERHIWSKTSKKTLQRLRRSTAFVASLLLILLILFGVIMLVIPALINAVKVIVQGIIDFVVTINAMSPAELEQLPFGSVLLNADWDKILKTLQEWLKAQGGTIMNTAVGTISSLVGGVFDFFISIVFSVYILFSKEKLKAQATRLVRAWLPKRGGAWLIHAASVLNVHFRNFVSGQTLEAVIIGVLCILGMLVLRIPYAPMVGALVGVTALIPVVGAFVGTIVGAFMIFTVSPFKAIIFVIFLVVLQQLEGNLIYPKVMGSRINLPGMWVLAAVIVGGGLAGPVGMLLGVPIASTVYVLIREATESREKKKKISIL